MGDFDALAADIYKDRVRRARLVAPEEKLRDGLVLWEMVLVRMKSGTLQHESGADDAAQTEVIRRQLATLRRLHEHGIYRPYPAEAPQT